MSGYAPAVQLGFAGLGVACAITPLVAGGRRMRRIEVNSSQIGYSRRHDLRAVSR